MGMAGMVVLGVVVACLVSKLVTIFLKKLVCQKKKHQKKRKEASHTWAGLASLSITWLMWQLLLLLGSSWLVLSVNYLVSKKLVLKKKTKNTKHQPCIGMAGVILGVIMARIIVELLSYYYFF